MNRNGRILFSSLKGGVGKSSAACEIAFAIASLGLKTVIVDLDFRSRSLDLMLGVSDSVVFNFGDFAGGRCTATDALLPVTVPKRRRGGAVGELLLCAACTEEEMESHGGGYDAIPDALLRLEEETHPDFVICDTGADSRVPVIVANGYARFALVVSEQSRTSVRASETTAARLRKCNAVKEVRLIINNFDIDAARRGGRAGIIDMIDGCATRCIGVIPHDPMLPIRQDAGDRMNPRSPVVRAAENIAARIMGVETPLFAKMKKERRRIVL